MFDRAMFIAAREHLGVRDKGGHAYILHPMRIAMRLNTNDEELMSIAILHDVIEDSKLSFEDLKAEGFTDRVIEALKLLTRQKGVSYDDYIDEMRGNRDALIRLGWTPPEGESVETLPVAPRQPAPHPGITHCDNCGCDWLDNGLNPVGCPYCKQSEYEYTIAAERDALNAYNERLRNLLRRVHPIVQSLAVRSHLLEGFRPKRNQWDELVDAIDAAMQRADEEAAHDTGRDHPTGFGHWVTGGA